jgi:hypothetical protein
MQVKSENDKVFGFSSQGTIFMFGKKYLTDEQQNSAGLAASLPVPLQRPRKLNFRRWRGAASPSRIARRQSWNFFGSFES